MQRYYMMFRDEKVYITSDFNDKVVEYIVDNSNRYPNIPFYYAIFNNEKIINNIKILIKESFNGGSSLKQMLSNRRVFILSPDDVIDATDIERRAFEELAKMIFVAKEVIFGSECAFVGDMDDNNFITISKTCRMTIISYIKDKKLIKQKFIENREYKIEELMNYIREIYDGFYDVPNIYLNGEHLSKYSEIGKVVESSKLLKTIRAVSDIIKI